VGVALDTNALSALADGDVRLGELLETVTELALPAIALGEYRYGISRSRHRRTYERWLKGVLEDVPVLPVLDSTTVQYAKLWSDLRKAGTPLPTNDVWIAAICLEHRLPLVTRDSHFAKVRSLKAICW